MTDISKQHHQREEDLFLLNCSASLALGSDQQSCSKIRAFLKELWGTEALLLLTTGGSKAGTPEQTSCLIAPMREEPGVTPSLVFTFLLKLLTNKKKPRISLVKKWKERLADMDPLVAWLLFQNHGQRCWLWYVFLSGAQRRDWKWDRTHHLQLRCGP